MILDDKQNIENQDIRSSALGIRGRLFIGFGLITLILLIAISITLYFVSTTKQYVNEVLEIDLPTYDHLLDLNAQILQSRASILAWVLTQDPKYKTELDRSWVNINHLELDLDNLSKNWTDVNLVKNWQDVKTRLVDIKDSEIKMENLTTETYKASNVLNELDLKTNKLLDVLDGLVNEKGERTNGIFDIQYNKLNQGTLTIKRDMTSLQVIEYTLSMIGIIFSILIALITIRSILRHINIFRNFSNKIATGDLRQLLAIESRDEIGQLGKDLNVMTKSLAAITKQIIESCHNMVSMLEEVKQAIDVQSSGATEQASSINEITSSLGEIEKSSAQTMEKAKTLGEVAERTRERGQKGLEAVEQSIQGMKSVRDKVQTIAQTILDLSNQTQQVGEITTLVNTLAQQSKMLALNASIEAAKAGEAGKGFAVVASEVKNLAEQSEQSTTQVQKILEDIRHATEKAVLVTEEGTKGVDYGTGLVEQTGEIVRSLSEVIHEATIASQQIEAAVRQESVGIEQITIGMNEINQVTSSFVASAKQTLDAINHLAKIAQDLKEYVDTYKI